MFKSFSVSNYKAFSHIEVSNLSQLNVIAGMNNVGKTAFLESIFLLSGCENIELVTKVNSFRGISEFKGDPAKIRDAMWRPLFRDLDTTQNIILEGKLQDGKWMKSQIEVSRGDYIISPVSNSTGMEPTSRASSIGEKLTLKFSRKGEKTKRTNMVFDERGPRVEPAPSPPFFPGYFISSYPPTTPREEAELFSQLEAIKETDMLLPTLQMLEPRLKRLAVIISAGIPMLHGDIGLGRMIPIPLMGDGLRRMTKILLAIGNSPKGVVLIDDIEFGLHHSNIERIWRALFDATSRYGTQLFITTHSYEWIQGAAHITKESFLNELRLFRLEMEDSRVNVISYDQESLKSAIQAELEVR